MGELQERLLAVSARIERLLAEKGGVEAIAWSAALRDRAAADAAVRRLLEEQEELFSARRRAYQSELAALDRQVEQHEQDAQSARRQQAAVERQHVSLDKELAGARRLLAKGLGIPRTRRSARAPASRRGGPAGRARWRLGRRPGGRRGDHGWPSRPSESGRLADIGQQLDEARREHAQADSMLRTASDIQDRLVLTSPMAGTIVDLRLTTIGGVLAPGEPLLDVVPHDQPLLVEVRLRPADIDSVRVGQTADVRMSAYRDGTVPTFVGRLAYVSADMLTDERSGETYFLARVQLDPSEPHRHPPGGTDAGHAH